MKAIKIWNFVLAMAFALIPVIVYREYSDAPNAFVIYQTVYVALAYWLVNYVFISIYTKGKPTFDQLTSKAAVIGFVATLAIGLLIYFTNG